MSSDARQGPRDLTEVIEEAARRKKAQDDCVSAFRGVVEETISPAFKEAANKVKDAGLAAPEIDQTKDGAITLRAGGSEISYEARAGFAAGPCTISLLSPASAGNTYTPQNLSRSDVDRDLTYFFEGVLLRGL